MLGIIILCDKKKADLNVHLDACVCVCTHACSIHTKLDQEVFTPIHLQ